MDFPIEHLLQRTTATTNRPHHTSCTTTVHGHSRLQPPLRNPPRSTSQSQLAPPSMVSPPFLSILPNLRPEGVLCVCHPLYQRGPHHSSHLSNYIIVSFSAGGHGSIHQSVANEATDVWRGYAVWSTARTCLVILTILFHPRVQAVAGHHR